MEKSDVGSKQKAEQGKNKKLNIGLEEGLKKTLDLTGAENGNLEEIIEEILGPLADDYCLRILAATREEGKTVRELNRELDIPIASCYRKVEELVDASLLEVKERKLTEDGKRATVLRTNISFVEISFGFEDDSLNVNIEPAK